MHPLWATVRKRCCFLKPIAAETGRGRCDSFWWVLCVNDGSYKSDSCVVLSLAGGYLLTVIIVAVVCVAVLVLVLILVLVYKCKRFLYHSVTWNIHSHTYKHTNIHRKGKPVECKSGQVRTSGQKRSCCAVTSVEGGSNTRSPQPPCSRSTNAPSRGCFSFQGHCSVHLYMHTIDCI